MSEKSVSLALTRFFLEHPLVTDVYLFGSVAMWGEGDDIDLVLAVSDSALADQFLQTLNEESMRIDKEGQKMEKLYGGVLKALRTGMVFQLLDWADRHQECIRICWDGMFEEWDALCVQNHWSEARKLEETHFHEPDLFLFPVGWQESEQVKTILPNWPSKRPFGTIDFHTVVRWQARRFNPQTNTFDKRQRLNEPEEQTYMALRQRERRSWKRRHKQNPL